MADAGMTVKDDPADRGGSAFEVRDRDGYLVVRVLYNGDILCGSKYPPTEAAKRFWEALEQVILMLNTAVPLSALPDINPPATKH